MSDYSVALIRVSSGYRPEIGIRGGAKWYVAGPRLGSQHGWYEDDIEIVRPLVVIDPEDHEQIERLAKAYYAAEAEALVGTGVTPIMQAALREFANPKPPKPAEPTGLGAVVEDSQGERWVRVAELSKSWRSEHASALVDYALIDAVSVLSDGVQP